MVTQRPAMAPEETGAFAVLAPGATALAVETVLEYAQEEGNAAPDS